jgi:hypothetical protein
MYNYLHKSRCLRYLTCVKSLCLPGFCGCKMGHKLIVPFLVLILETCMGHYLLNQTAGRFKIVYNLYICNPVFFHLNVVI